MTRSERRGVGRSSSFVIEKMFCWQVNAITNVANERSVPSGGAKAATAPRQSTASGGHGCSRGSSMWREKRTTIVEMSSSTQMESIDVNLSASSLRSRQSGVTHTRKRSVQTWRGGPLTILLKESDATIMKDRHARKPLASTMRSTITLSPGYAASQTL